MRIDEGRGEALDGDPITSHGFDERLEVGGGGHDRQRAAGPGSRAGGRHEHERERGCARAVKHGYFLTKIDFGTMQCTPLRISTTWLTRQSPTIDVSA